MQHKKRCSLLMAGLIVVAMAGCSSSPSEEEIMSALEKGTITVEDAKSKGWIDDAWIEKHFEPVEAKSKIYLLDPFDTTYLDGTPASSQLIEGTMCLVFFNSTVDGSIDALKKISKISEQMKQLGVPVLAIITDHDVDAARASLPELKFPVIVYNEEMEKSFDFYKDLIEDNVVSVFTKDGGIYSAWNSDCSAEGLLDAAEGIANEK